MNSGMMCELQSFAFCKQRRHAVKVNSVTPNQNGGSRVEADVSSNAGTTPAAHSARTRLRTRLTLEATRKP